MVINEIEQVLRIDNSRQDVIRAMSDFSVTMAVTI